MSEPVPSTPQNESRTRSALIFAAIGVTASIIFGLLYLFVLAPNVPSGNIGWFLFSFATGLTMIVMPCTLPLAFVIVPLSMGKGLVRGLGMALSFGVGIATTLSLYGILAAILGGVALDTLGADLESVKNWVYFGAGIFAFTFALGELGLINVHMPTYSGAAPAMIQKRSEIIKAFLLGLFLGNVGVGCPHPATPLILIEIATSGDVLYGWLLFLTHAIGRILPLLLLAFLAILGVNGLNWLMTRKATVERVTGWMMVFVAGFILTLGLFTHDWWVNSGLHSGLESLTQEAYFNTLLNETLDQSVAHVHGLETGTGLFGLPLEWGSWFLVFLWLIPIWWWYHKKKKHMYHSPAFKLASLEAEMDKLEKERRDLETIVKLEDLDPSFDLKAVQTQIDGLEKERRLSEDAVHFGESGEYKDKTAREYEVKILNMQRNYLLLISAALAIIFIHYMPTTFYLKSISMSGDHHGASTGSGTAGIHAMPDGTIMDAKGQVLSGAVLLPDGTIKLVDGTIIGTPRTPFSKSILDLPDAVGPIFVDLNDGDTYSITASYVKKEVGNRTLRMLAYNRSIPGPFIKAKVGSAVTINFTNNTDVDQTIHSHGLRLDNRFDGVPDVTQPVVKPGESFTYQISFPDIGMAWYHPHTRDDFGQEMGLYGTYLVEPLEEGYWSAVNREVPLVIDDILIENNQIADFYKETVDHALLGRFGNTYLVNGMTDYILDVRQDEVIRFLVTNVSNARTYKLSLPGAEMKVVGAEWGRYEQEEYKSDVLISPAERLVIEAHFLKPGVAKLVHVTPDREITLAQFRVLEERPAESYVEEFNNARRNIDVKNEFDTLRSEYMNKPLDKRALLTLKLTGAVDHSAHNHAATTVTDESMPHSHTVSGQSMSMPMMKSGIDAIQWDDVTNSDKNNTLANVEWQIVDQQTGKVSMAIDDWTFKVGDYAKIRFTNDSMAAHVMQHPIHFHGQKFVVLSNNGVPNTNMVWKDTALVLPGEYIDVLVEMSNPGVWMAHCHISEHLHAGMMLGFRVEDENGYAPGDEFRATVAPSGMHASMSGMPTILPYKFEDSSVTDSEYYAMTDIQSVVVNKNTLLQFSFRDKTGNPLLLDDAVPIAVSVTFVSSDNNIKFLTYPGNTVFPAPIQPPKENIPGTPGFDESKPHSHSWRFIPVAYAHGGVDDGHLLNTTGRTYSVPVQFPQIGNYKAFVEFKLAGEDKTRISVVTIEVNNGSFSVDNFGWSLAQKWWILLVISLLLMVPLVIGVRKYINV